MTRFARCLMALCAMLLMTACAESIHQTERLTRGEFAVDPRYADAPFYSYWSGPGYGYGLGYGAGYWRNPFGYYGYPYGPLGYGWYGGYRGSGGFHGPSGSPGPRPMPPANAPPQFRKKY